MLKGSPDAIIGSNEKLNIVGAGTTQFFADDEDFLEIIQLLKFLDVNRSEEEVTSFLHENKINPKLLNKLKNANLIINDFDDKRYNSSNIAYKNRLYLNHILDNANTFFEKIHQYNFWLFGCGGIGNYISYALSSYPIKKLILIDGDRIENNNLNRQFMFTKNDISKYKVDVLKHRLTAINPELSINSIKEFIHGDNIAKLMGNFKEEKNFIILSGDSIQSFQMSQDLLFIIKYPS